MPRSHLRRLMALALLALAGAPAFAQPAPEGAPPDTKAERQKNAAAKLAGLVAFVDASCPGLKGDPEMLAQAVTRLGIEPADLGQGELVLRAKGYAEIYGKEVETSCKRAQDNFGPTGTTLPNLIVRK